jgi:hypothetical protein
MWGLRFSRQGLWRIPSFGIKKPSSYLTGNTLHLCYTAQPVIAMWCLTFPRQGLWRMPSSGVYRSSSYLIGNTLRLRYRTQAITAMWGLKLSRRWLWRMPSSWMLRRVALVRSDAFLRSVLRLLITANVVPRWVNYFYPEDGGDTFLQNVGSYNSHTA